MRRLHEGTISCSDSSSSNSLLPMIYSRPSTSFLCSLLHTCTCVPLSVRTHRLCLKKLMHAHVTWHTIPFGLCKLRPEHVAKYTYFLTITQKFIQYSPLRKQPNFLLPRHTFPSCPPHFGGIHLPPGIFFEDLDDALLSHCIPCVQRCRKRLIKFLLRA